MASVTDDGSQRSCNFAGGAIEAGVTDSLYQELTEKFSHTLDGAASETKVSEEPSAVLGTSARNSPLLPPGDTSGATGGVQLNDAASEEEQRNDDFTCDAVEAGGSAVSSDDVRLNGAVPEAGVLGRPLVCLWRGASLWVPVCFLAWRLHTLSRLRSDPTRRLQTLKADCFVMGMRALCHLHKTGRRACLLICPVSGEFCTPRSHWYVSGPSGQLRVHWMQSWAHWLFHQDVGVLQPQDFQSTMQQMLHLSMWKRYTKCAQRAEALRSRYFPSNL